MRQHKAQAGVQGVTGRAQSFQHSESSVINLPTEICSDVAAWLQALAAEKDAAEKRREVETRLATNVEPLWRERCRHDGQVHPHVTLNGSDVGRITMVRHKGFCRMGYEDGDRLLSIFGTKDFEQYFDNKTTISIDVEKLTDRQAELMASALAENAADVLTVEMVVVPRASYWQDRVLKTDIQKKAIKAEAEGLALPFTPCFRPPQVLSRDEYR